jgi:hypothetical protein
VRRSQRVSRPSAKVTDPNNAVAASHKCKRVHDAKRGAVTHRCVLSPASEEDTEAELSNNTGKSASCPEDTELEEDDAADVDMGKDEDDTVDADMGKDEDLRAAYERTKALGDKDRKVRSQIPLC